MNKTTKAFCKKYKDKIKDGKITMYKLYQEGVELKYLIDMPDINKELEQLEIGYAITIEKIKSYV